jgi:hypothetical protein
MCGDLEACPASAAPLRRVTHDADAQIMKPSTQTRRVPVGRANSHIRQALRAAGLTQIELAAPGTNEWTVHSIEGRHAAAAGDAARGRPRG